MRVGNITIITKIKVDIHLLHTIRETLMGRERSISKVRVRFSSAISRIVNAGIRSKRSIDERLKNLSKPA